MARVNNRLSQARRLDSIRSELVKADEVSIEQLAARFKVSGMTIRRDLELLESRGDIVRTYGGAALAKRLTFEFAFREKQNKNRKHKRLIARRALEHIKDGQVIMLDTGTTTLGIAQELMGKRKVTVITTSLAIVSKVQFASGIKVVLLGGFLRGGSPDMHGPLTEQNVDQFKADIAFMGADAIDNDGNTYADDLCVLNLDRKMASNAAKVIVVADSSKFGASRMCKVFGHSDYDLIITDSEIDKGIVRQLGKKKVQVEFA